MKHTVKRVVIHHHKRPDEVVHKHRLQEGIWYAEFNLVANLSRSMVASQIRKFRRIVRSRGRE